MMTFTVKHDNLQVTVSISEDSNLEEAAEAFRGFLKAGGYAADSVDALFVE